MKTLSPILLLNLTLLLLFCQPNPCHAEDSSEPSTQPQAADESEEEVPYSQEIKEEKPARKKPVYRTPPKKWGDRSGHAYFGQRIVYSKYAGWGWIKNSEGGGWSGAKWAMIEEVPGVRMSPSRFYNHPSYGNNMQYRLYGEWAEYKGYEPNIDVLVPVFRIKGFEVVGKGEEIARTPPRGSRSSRSSSIATRGANLHFRKNRR